ncbi:NUDIX hydrolase [Limosilactobacillus reuteri]|uniref:NUDIX domain-containing protein n=1 Tax=Limosilactobacillus reuteri TaxID=1598 RepID=A0AAX2STP3_LIMRT|nr:NUDIX hydrolase [Limosilactobacillus reuteri]RMX27377.1 NTP pyrophosphohydrolase [Limosilactobacillus reuteri]TGB11693.1 NUDIX domain-containing protein [Limosilactobacillus reuteri]
MAYIKEIRDLVGHRPLIMTSASGALLDQQGAVLLQERADTGDWGFPGGYMEFGESFEQTVKREFKEDAGIEIVPVNRLAVLDQDFYTYPNGDRVQPINAFYLVEETSAKHYQPKVTETTTIEYFSLDEEPPRFFNSQHEQMWQILKDFTHNRKDI